MDNSRPISLSKIQITHKDALPSAADVSVAETIRNRNSNCTACGDEGCDTKGPDATCSCGDKAKESMQTLTNVADRAPSYLEVEFKGTRRGLFKNDKKVSVALSELVVVESETGIDLGRVSAVGTIAAHKLASYYAKEIPRLNVLRLATEADMAQYELNRESEKTITKECREIVERFNLDMKVADAEWQFDKQRLTLYFTAPARVDFRELVKELARTYKARIELRQISAREEARRIGGVGVCGLELCCTTFKRDFEHITLDHARLQQLSNNVLKLSGMCGRLKCCLLYEIDNYTDSLKNYPPLHSSIDMPQGGVGKMIKIDIFKDIISVYIPQTSSYATLTLAELNKLRADGRVRIPTPEELYAYQNRNRVTEDVILN
jgi:cell fate regulator YaaT (PSP1 superfamily)